jgi:hypothetical protein
VRSKGRHFFLSLLAFGIPLSAFLVASLEEVDPHEAYLKFGKF